MLGRIKTMLFAISPGSDGSGGDRFVASIPFVLSPGSTLQLEETVIHSFEGGNQVKLEKLQLRYSASVGPYSSEAEAQLGLQRLTAALLWSTLEFNVGLQYPGERGLVHLHEQPIPIPSVGPMANISKITGWQETDGHYDADSPVVLPDHKRLVRFEGGRATFTAGIGGDNFLKKLAEALEFPRTAAVAEDKKLRLAIEICAGHKFEISDSAQFVALVTALEALLPDSAISPAAASALDIARAAVLEARKQYAEGSVERSQVDHLLSRLGGLKQEAIGTAMRSFVLATVQRHQDLGNTDATSLALRDAYFVRCRLLHDGHVDPALLGKKLAFLRQFVPKLLRALFLEKAGV
jgi:hypothetical protein